MKKIHFIGIGGIGLSALARLLKQDGYEISGSDIKKSALTENLKKEGIKVTVPHSKKAINSQDIVIYSAAVSVDNCELVEAKKENIPINSRKEAIKWILKDKKVLAVAGAHGKSTTSAMLGAVIDKSMLVGAESKQFKSNMRYSKDNNLMVFEADESDASFLNSNPYLAIVTNCEPEHMEYYNYDYDKFYNCYKKFISLAKIRVLNGEDEYLKTLDIDAIWLYPSKDIKNIKTIIKNNQPYTTFELKDFGTFEVWGIGEHIAIDGALAILGAMEFLGIEQIKENLKNYQGIKKRFDVVVAKNDFVIIDDYAHHPTEIKATIKSVKTYSKLLDLKNLTAIWQPHKYSRTIDNMNGFVNCFEGVDNLIILPVWNVGEREQEIDFPTLFKKSNPIIADKIQNKDGINLIKNGKIIKNFDKGVVIGFGAGDITNQLRGD